MLNCPACLNHYTGDYVELARHLEVRVGESDSDHVMWMNRYLSRTKISTDIIKERLEQFFRTDTVKSWVISRAVKMFYGDEPNPYIAAMQNPGGSLMLGYAWEHHHFLKQWVRSCSLIIANTDREDVQKYEIENIISEWYGSANTPSHHELLLRMAESYGMKREDIYAGKPLKITEDCIEFWDSACRDRTFVEGMAAMHSMELIPSRKMKQYGASMTYFNPALLEGGTVTGETIDFLREGYEADAGHSEAALDLVDKYAAPMDMVQPCQALALKSLEKFYEYLMARLQRGNMIEDEQY